MHVTVFLDTANPFLSPSQPHQIGPTPSLIDTFPGEGRKEKKGGGKGKGMEGQSSKSLQKINSGDGLEKKEPFYTVGGNVK